MAKGILTLIDNNGSETQLTFTTSADLVSYSDTTVAEFLNNLSAAAGTAEFADTAEKAEKDSEGNVITSTYALKNSPAFTGTPTAPTANDLDLLTNQVATVAWCNNVFKRFTGIVPENMDTLQEFWAALGQDYDLATTISTQLATKQDKSDILTSLSNLSLSADKTFYATGSETLVTTPLTTFGRTIISKSDAKEIRKMLGIYRHLWLDEIEVNRWQTIGSPTISTANAKFRYAAQFANNQGIYITPAQTFGGADFTIDLWCYMDSTTPNFGLFLLCTSDGTEGNAGYKDCILLGRNDSEDALMISVCDENGDALLENKHQEISPAVSMLGTFRHYEIDYKVAAQTIYLFVDGVLKYSKSGVNVRRTERAVILGLNNIGRAYSLIGSISEFRLQDGICQHTTDFTPPNTPYEVDEYTLSLMHFD